MPVGGEVGYVVGEVVGGGGFGGGFGVGEDEDAGLVGGEVDALAGYSGGGGDGGVGVPLLGGFVSGGEGGGDVDGLVRGVDDEVDVGGGELAADEADLVLGAGVGVGEFEVGRGRLTRALPSWALSGTTGMAAVRPVSSGDGLAFGVEGGSVANGDDFASGGGPGVDLAEGFDGDAVGGWDDEDLVGSEADGVDGFGVDEVEVIAGGEDGGDDRGGDELLHGSGDGDVGGGEAGPGVVGGEEDGDLVGGLALAEEVADALDVLGDGGHDRVPGVVVVEDAGGVEGPAGFGDFAVGWGVGPAVEDELVLAHDEVDVGFGLHVEWGGSEDGGVEPGEGLAGGDVIAEDVICRGGPAECGKRAPLWTFAFGETGEILAGKVNRWFSIGLRAKLGVMRDGPVIDLSQVVLVNKFGESLAPVVPYLVGGGGSTGD